MGTFNLRKEMPDLRDFRLVQQWNEVERLMGEIGVAEAPCCMARVTRSTLFKTARAMGAKRILDIGTFTGFSMLTFAHAVGEGGKVVTVDIKEQNDAADSWWKVHGRNMSPRDLLIASKLDDRVEFVAEDSRIYLSQTDDKFDLICIDGWHDHTGVYQDFDLSLDCLNPDGMIFMDDVQMLDYTPPPGFDRIHGPASALQRHMAEGMPVRPFFPIPGIPVCFVLATA